MDWRAVLRRITWGDWALSVMILVFLAVPSLFVSVAPTSGMGGAVLGLLVVGGMATMVPLRTVRPVTSAVVIYLLAFIQWVTWMELMPLDLVVLLALYSVTVHGPRRAGLVALGGGLLGAVLFGIRVGALYSWRLVDVAASAIMVGLLVTATWAFALVRRTRIERYVALQERARALESERHRESELAVITERARIAREMHDIVAHSLAVIIAQADGGRYAARSDPELGIKALDTVAEIGRDALADIRRVLGVLRTTEGNAAIELPQPTSNDLVTLIERVRSTGASVSFAELGQVKPLLPGMGLTIQRVCQEAMTNALKHAGDGASIAVMLQWFDDSVVLKITDDGRGAAAMGDGLGSGLIGMRERAGLFGGNLEAEPLRAGGFMVRMTLPLHPTGQPRPYVSKELPGHD